MSEHVKDILKQNRLSVTVSRQKILSLFLKKGNALSHADIEKNTGDLFDRVTVYRTLQTFVESGIIHLIPTTDNSVKYALSKDDCLKGQHRESHIHFICDKCKKTICLDQVNAPAVKLPKGFALNRTEIVVSGICNKCR